MYDTRVYEVAPHLWRWEIRCGGKLLKTGTAPTEAEARNEIQEAIA